ncbi:MAG: recombination protein RecR [Candidatus Marinimicrobia bacterium]|nr:recombination protein RecR [Candidatus Neomarinimicrobiota bacterium]
MNSIYPEILSRLIDLLSKLPGIGKKTAERLAFDLIKSKDDDYLNKLSVSIKNIKSSIKIAPVCNCFTDLTSCGICNNPNRDKSIICVVESQQDVFFIEKSGFQGCYHVLGGVISPLDGITIDDLNFENLIKRISGVNEIILAIPLSVEGEATFFYIKDLLKDYDLKITRPSRGLPIGVNIEYVDQLTLQSSIEDRIEI